MRYEGHKTKTLYIFRGPPATGKSTMRAEMIADNPTIVCVNKDELREEFPGATEREIHERLMAAMDRAARAGLDVINDNTNLNPRTVNGYRSWAERNGYTVKVVDFGQDVPFEEAVTRDYLRGSAGGRTVGRSVIYQFYVDAGLLPVPLPEARRPVVLIDLDGTACNITHRVHHVQGGKKDWKAFNAAIPRDTPNPPVQMVYWALVTQQHHIIFLSGRGAEQRAVTERWLAANGYADYEAVVMRPYGDSRPDHVVKRELYEKYVAPYWRTELVLDDRDSVVAGWRELGLTCFQVAPGNF